jgi:hypothetical protein
VLSISATGDDLAADASLHIRHLFGPLVNEQHDEVHFGMVLNHRLGDVLKQNGFAGARRGHDQTALPFADGREQVHDARGQSVGGGFQPNRLMGINRREIVELARPILLRRLALDGLHARQTRPRSFASGVYRAGEKHPLTKAELLNEGSGNVRVGLLGDIVTSGVA